MCACSGNCGVTGHSAVKPCRSTRVLCFNGKEGRFATPSLIPWSDGSQWWKDGGVAGSGTCFSSCWRSSPSTHAGPRARVCSPNPISESRIRTIEYMLLVVLVFVTVAWLGIGDVASERDPMELFSEVLFRVFVFIPELFETQLQTHALQQTLSDA